MLFFMSLQLPTIGILTNGMHYIIFKYTEDPLELVQYQRLSLPATMGTRDCKSEEIRRDLETLVTHLVAIIKSEIAAAELHLPEIFKSKRRGVKSGVSQCEH